MNNNLLILFIDLDATIVDVGNRFVLNPPPEGKNREDYEYQQWLQKVQTKELLMKDKPVSAMRELIWGLYSLNNVHASYLTSRNDYLYETTQEWLALNGFPLLPLIMRGPDDKRPSGKLKEAQIKEKIKTYNNRHNIIVIDDDPKGDLEERCIANGWTFLKARSGGTVL